MSKQQTRPAFLYKIFNRDDEGYDIDTPFEETLRDISNNLSGEEKAYNHKDDDPEARVKLLKFDQAPNTKDMYQGLIGVYGSPDFKVGDIEDNIIEDYTLPDGKRPTELVHFVYSPKDKILVLTSNTRAIQVGGFMRYINYLVPKVFKDIKLIYEREIICHKDAIDIIKNAKSIKSAEISIPVDVIKQNDLKRLLDISSMESSMDGLGSVVLTFKSRRGKDLMKGSDIDKLLEDMPIENFPKQKYKVEFEDGLEKATVNLLQAKFNSRITINNYDDQDAYNNNIYNQLIEIYRNSKGKINE